MTVDALVGHGEFGHLTGEGRFLGTCCEHINQQLETSIEAVLVVVF